MTKTFLTIAALAIATPAIAEPVTINVPTAGIDLTTVDGRAELEQRAARIAADECGVASAADLKGKRVVEECKEAVMVAAQRHAAQLRSADASQ